MKQYFSEFIVYSHLQVKRWILIFYILIRTPLNYFNLLTLLFVVPFCFTTILPTYGIFSTTLYLTSFILILLVASYLTLLLKYLEYSSFFYAFIPSFLVGIVFLLKFGFDIPIGILTIGAFSTILSGHLVLLYILGLIVILLLTQNFIFLKKLIYKLDGEERVGPKLERFVKKRFINRYLNSFLRLEIKLEFRNKSLRIIYLVPIFLILLTYFVFVLKPINNLFLQLFWFIGVCSAGYSYFQYMFSWESSYFDFISATNLNILKYIETKYIIHVLFVLINTILILPLVISKRVDIHILFTAMLYTIGIGSFITLYFATFNNRRIDLSSSMFFNPKGFSGIHMISLSLAGILPLFLITFFTSFINETMSLFMLNLVCVFSLLKQKQWMQIIQKQFLKRKYINLEGFRK